LSAAFSPISDRPVADQGGNPVADHGGALDRAISRFGGARADWIDLSTGINPWPYPVPAISPDAWTRLPDERALGDLVIAARIFYGAPAEASLCVAPGSQALIQLLPRLVRQTSVAVVGPTYGEHARCWALAGHTVEMVEGVDASAAPILVLVNPNNPDGRVWSPRQLSGLAERQAARGGLLLVDEAFAEVVPDASAMAETGRPGLVVLRSFGKFFGLAGLRLGFAFGPADLIDGLNAGFGPWAVAGPALEIGRAALSDLAWAAATRDRLKLAAGGLDAILRDVGLEPVGGTDLFRLVRIADAGGLADRLGRHHILVRRFIDQPDRLRFGLPPDEAALMRLRAALIDA